MLDSYPKAILIFCNMIYHKMTLIDFFWGAGWGPAAEEMHISSHQSKLLFAWPVRSKLSKSKLKVNTHQTNSALMHALRTHVHKEKAKLKLQTLLHILISLASQRCNLFNSSRETQICHHFSRNNHCLPVKVRMKELRMFWWSRKLYFAAIRWECISVRMSKSDINEDHKCSQ